MIPGGLAVLMFALLGLILVQPVRLMVTGDRAAGIVVGVDSSVQGSGAVERMAFVYETPLVEFVTSSGERVRVSGREDRAPHPLRPGASVAVAYDTSSPESAQLLVLSECQPVEAGMILGFFSLVILACGAAISIQGNPERVQALSRAFRLDLLALRFAAYVFMPLVIVLCAGASCHLARAALDLRAAGTRRAGVVVGSRTSCTDMQDLKQACGRFPTSTYHDASGTSYTIGGSTAYPLSRLTTGDAVEIIYPAGRPRAGHQNTWVNLWLTPIFFGCFALRLVVALRPTLTLLRDRRRDQ